MTSIAAHPRQAPLMDQERGQARAPGEFSVFWRIDVRALAGAESMAIKGLGDAVDARLQVHLCAGEMTAGIAVLRKVSGGAEVWIDAMELERQRTGAECVQWDGERSLMHVDVAGVVAITLRMEEGGTRRLVFARSPLLERIGVPGGRAERPEVVWR